jgi:hypothetical protein
MNVDYVMNQDVVWLRIECAVALLIRGLDKQVLLNRPV